MSKMNCLWCDQEIILEISWKNLLMLSNPKQLCNDCENELEVLQGNRCIKCSRLTTSKTCTDCERWSNHKMHADVLTFNYSVYHYNERMQDMLAKWKYRGDYIIGNAFKEQFIHTFINQFSWIGKDAIIVPIPLSEERLRERGFNQAKVLADFLPMENKEMITRIHSEKQSKKSRHERISANNPFMMSEKVNKAAILVDDIYTTGATLRHASKLLIKNGCPNVYAFTLIRG